MGVIIIKTIALALLFLMLSLTFLLAGAAVGEFIAKKKIE